jgi:DNA repair protein RadC
MSDETLHYRPRIHDLPDSERPRERLKAYGAEPLSSAELLAILLRTGTTGENVLALSQRLISEFDGLAGLAHAGFGDLARVKGVGEAKVAQLKAGLELGRRMVASQPAERPQITSPLHAANLVMPLIGGKDQEHLLVVLLDTKNRVIATPIVYVGNVNSSIIRPAEVFREAVRHNAPNVIIAHNHPSGDPAPSAEDITITRQLIEAGKILDITLLDHIVIGHQRFISLKEKKLGFETS